MSTAMIPVPVPASTAQALGMLEAAMGYLADAIITARRLIREAWTLYRWADRPVRRP